MNKSRDSFGILVDTGRKSIKYDPWTKDRGILGYCEEIIGETKELEVAFNNNDVENISEELGDILMDWVHLTLLAEEKYGIKMRNIIEDVNAKLIRRKPYMADKKPVTKEEALEIWKKVKKIEKERKAAAKK